MQGVSEVILYYSHYKVLICKAYSNFQIAYAQYMKLVALFVFAVVHVMYMIPFLRTFAAVASSVDITDVTPSIGSLHLRHFVETLADVSYMFV